jgi:uncharacterized protein (DUF1800 family)
MGTATFRLSRRRGLGVAAGGAAAAAGIRYITLQQPGAAPAAVAASGAGSNGAWASPLGTQQALSAHLLRRAGFGYSDAELESAASLSYGDLVDKLVHQQPDPLPTVADPTSYPLVVRTWYAHMASTPAQFPERMTLFWHGLLTSDYRKAAGLPFVLQQNRLYRAMGRGDLRSLITAVTYDPLMIRYLDLEQSTAKSPNENYSRELMELFTLGPGNYSENDVREGARAFSGIRTRLVDASGTPMRLPPRAGMTPQQYHAQIAQLLAQGATFKGALDARQHDIGAKTFLGQAGNLDPEQAIDIILAQPSCAPHIARNALVHFCTPNPSPALVNDIAAQFRNSGYDISTLMRAIFTSQDFTAAANYRALVRAPADYMVATMRALNRPDLAATCVESGAGMNQILYDMPTVAGWPSGQGWVSSCAWLSRLNFAARVVSTQTSFPDPAQAVRTQLDSVVGPDTAAVFNASQTSADRWYAVLASPEFHLK